MTHKHTHLTVINCNLLIMGGDGEKHYLDIHGYSDHVLVTLNKLAQTPIGMVYQSCETYTYLHIGIDVRLTEVLKDYARDTRKGPHLSTKLSLIAEQLNANQCRIHIGHEQP